MTTLNEYPEWVLEYNVVYLTRLLSYFVVFYGQLLLDCFIFESITKLLSETHSAGNLNQRLHPVYGVSFPFLERWGESIWQNLCNLGSTSQRSSVNPTKGQYWKTSETSHPSRSAMRFTGRVSSDVSQLISHCIWSMSFPEKIKKLS